MKASVLAGRLSTMLHDTNRVRWTEAMLLGFISDAQRALVGIRPDTNPIIADITLVQGQTVQQIPANGGQLLDVLCNVVDGVAGESVTLTTKDALDTTNRSWHSADPVTVVYNFAYDEDVPQHFFVTPPPPAGLGLRIKYSKIPDEVTSLDDDLEVSDIHMPTLYMYCMFLALSLNIDSALDRTVDAQKFLASFLLSAGQVAQATALLSPNNTNINASVTIPQQGQ